MDATVIKVVGSVFAIITLVVILARSEAFNSIIAQGASSSVSFMKAAAGEK